MPDCWRHSFLSHGEQVDWTLTSLPLELIFLITPVIGAPLCSAVQAEWTKCVTTILEEPTQKMGETEEVPQSTKCLLPAQHQTGETPLRQVNRKFCTFLGMLSRASLLDHGWNVWCRGKEMCGHQHRHSGGGGTDHTEEVRKIWPIAISSIPPLFILETASSNGGYEMDMLAHASVFRMIIPFWTQMLRKLAFHMLGTPTIVAVPQRDKRLCSTD